MLLIKKLIGKAVFLALFCFSISSVGAIQLELTPSSHNVTQGDTVNVDVDITGLGDFTSDSLSVFDIDILFDITTLGFDSVVFGDSVLGDQLDLFGFGSITNVTLGAASVNLFELSFDLASDLNTLQAGEFTLASLTFNTLAVGNSVLGININALGDANGSSLTATALGTNITIVSNIPEPATWFMFSIGLLMLVLHRNMLFRRKP